MTETEFHIDISQEKICDLDVSDNNLFIAYTDNKEIITSDKKIALEIGLKYPIVRLIDEEKFLLLDSRTDSNKQNAFIYDFNGQLLKTFLAGDGIQDVLIQNNKIVITYFDEGVFGKDGPNNNGLTVFNFDGKQEFGFNESIQDLHIYDCYCICKQDKNKVLFYAYDFFNVVQLNLDNFEWQEFKTPNDFEGASAMTNIDDKIIFHSSYHDKKSFFLWDRQSGEVTKVGEYGSDLKGLQGGKFLTFGEKAFVIIDVLN